MLVTTTENIAGYKIVETLGIVRGNSVRAKWFGSDFLAGLRNIVGGEVVQYMKLLSEARELALQRMTQDAEKLGANAIIMTNFSTSQITPGAAEILVFGTAVKVVPAKG